MTDLLPPNATHLERTIDGASARLDGMPVPLRDLWSPQRCPLAVLPWLAWALRVETWDSEWPPAVKRRVVAEALEVHREKGTLAAIRRVLDQIGAVYDIFEGPDAAQGLAAMQARVCILNSESIAFADSSALAPALDRAKRASVHLDLKFSAGLRAPTPLAAGFGLLPVIRLETARPPS